MEFVNISFSKSSVFMGFHGTASQIGSAINQLGVVTFSCAPDKIQPTDDANSDSGTNNETSQGDGASIFDTTNTLDSDDTGGTTRVIVTPDEPEVLVREDQKEKQTLIIVAILIAFVLIVAITATIVFCMRRAKRVEKHDMARGDNELAPLGQHQRDRQAVVSHLRRS